MRTKYFGPRAPQSFNPAVQSLVVCVCVKNRCALRDWSLNISLAVVRVVTVAACVVCIWRFLHVNNVHGRTAQQGCPVHQAVYQSYVTPSAANEPVIRDRKQ